MSDVVKELLRELGVEGDLETEEGVRAAQKAITSVLALALPARLGKPDWSYIDLPPMSPKCMSDFKELLGEENVEWITFAESESSQRGQVLISPEGMRRIKLVAETKGSRH